MFGLKIENIVNINSFKNLISRKNMLNFIKKKIRYIIENKNDDVQASHHREIKFLCLII